MSIRRTKFPSQFQIQNDTTLKRRSNYSQGAILSIKILSQTRSQTRREGEQSAHLGDALRAAAPHHACPPGHQRDSDHRPHDQPGDQPHPRLGPRIPARPPIQSKIKPTQSATPARSDRLPTRNRTGSRRYGKEEVD